MKPLIFSLFFALGTSSVTCQCLYPPCAENGADNQETHPCTRTREMVAEIQHNISDLSEALVQFRESVSRDMHILHQNQMEVLGQAAGSGPPSSQPHAGSRFGHKHHRHRHNHHHHHHDDMDVPRAFMRPPNARNPEDFDFASCLMFPNSAEPNLTSRISGIVYLSQKKNSDTLYLHIMLRNLKGSSTSRRHHHASSGGRNPHPRHQEGEERETLHGFHVHETADFSQGCNSAGPHFNPFNVTHGGPNSVIRHVGDFGNLVSDEEGAINELITDERASLRGEHSIIGKSLVIHAQEDDLGVHPNDPGSTTTGNSGARLACCLIRSIEINATVPESNQEVPHAPDQENGVQHRR